MLSPGGDYKETFILPSFLRISCFKSKDGSSFRMHRRGYVIPNLTTVFGWFFSCLSEITVYFVSRSVKSSNV